MALTYRQTKGSALTIEELDANFAFFTGSHSISWSSTLPVIISGSLEVTGSFSVASGPVIITGLSTTEPTVSGSLWLSGSTATGASRLLAVKV